MKNLIFPSLLTATIAVAPPPVFAQHTAPSKHPLNVAIVVYPGVEALDMSGPLDVFVKANDVSPGSFNVFTVAQSRTPIQTEAGGLTLTPKYTLATAPRPDIVVVPGSSTARVNQVGADEQLQKWLRQNATSQQRVMSVCTGAYIIGRAGLLNNKNSTTHWFALSDFQRQFPKTRALRGVRFVRDGNVLSAAGVSSGIDGALQLVEEIRGKQTADLVARVIQYRRGTASFPTQARERVRVHRVTSKPTTQKQLALDYDPVCHMKVTTKTADKFEYKGKLYGFCAPGCREAFASHPEEFIKSK